MANVSLIKIKSEELAIPFSHVLSGYMLELAVEKIAEATYAKDMLLCNSHVLGIDVYKKKASLELEYQYVGEMELASLSRDVMEDICLMYEEKGIQILSAKEKKLNPQEWQILFQMNIEEMYIPIKIRLQKVEQIFGYPKTESIRLFMENNRTVDVRCFPVEQSVAMHVAMMLKHLELLNEMKHYVLAYDELMRYPMEGRKVKDELDHLCETMHIAKTKKPLAIWKTYKSYAYMKKKWKVLLRQEKRSEPSWEECFALLDKFITPIWESICKEEVFFGDWMPELGRFLD